MKLLNFNSAIIGGKLADMPERWSSEEIATHYYTSARKAMLAIDGRLFRITRRLRGLDSHIQYNAFFNMTQRSVMVEEVTDGKTSTIAIYKIGEKSITIASLNEAGAYFPYDETLHSGNVVLAAVALGFKCSDSEMEMALNQLSTMVDDDENAEIWEDELMKEDLSKVLCLVTNNMYYRYKAEVSAVLEIDIQKLRVADVKKFKDGNEQVLYGKMGKASKKAKAKEYAKGELAFVTRTLSPIEESLIPTMPKSYIFPNWVARICEDIKASTEFMQPIRNVLLVGAAGTGKTKGAQAISYLLGLPYSKITCSPDSDMFDLIGQLLPNTDGIKVDGVFEKLGIPTFDDVDFDFEGSYEKLFGKKPGKADAPADCYGEILKRTLEGLQMTSDFTYVESDLIKAIKNGWVCEIQEPTVIKREAVLVGLNALLESEGSITLPTGKVIKRHPDCVIVMTTNADYKGCKSLQQSVLSRMDLVREIPLPECEVLVSRASAQTGFADKTLLKKMVNTVLEINTYANEHGITDGVTGPRELNNWAKLSLINAKREGCELGETQVIEAAFPTLLQKVSQMPEEIEEIITAVFQKQFDQFAVETARTEYLLGNI